MPLVEEAVPAELEPGDMTIVLGSLYHAGGENNTVDEQRETVGIFFTKGFYRQAENEYLSVPPELCKGLKFNHSNSFYYAGEKVTGIISFHNTDTKLTLNHVSFGFIGEIGYTKQQLQYSNDGFGHEQIQNRTVYHQLPFINIPLPFAHSTDNENKVMLDRGHHSWPFEFTLPQYLPPSSGSLADSYPYIKYYAYITIDQTWYKSCKKQIFPLIIFPRVDIFNVHEDRQSMAEYNRNHLHVKAYLSRQSILPGEKVSLDIHLKNHTRLKIKGIEAIVIQHREIDQNHHAEVIFKMDLPLPEDFTKTKFHQIFDLNIPSGYLPPTYHYMAPYSDSSIRTRIHYELKLEVKVHEWLNEIHLSIPITIGTESSLEQSQWEENSYGGMPINYTTLLKEMNAPPTYESAIANIKLQDIVL
ncbi:unnamed protein product [Rotaria sp. Silwood1]|nr:unnamed protein product [Rotaria sp. Silwood1]